VPIATCYVCWKVEDTLAVTDLEGAEPAPPPPSPPLGDGLTMYTEHKYRRLLSFVQDAILTTRPSSRATLLVRETNYEFNGAVGTWNDGTTVTE